MIVPEHVQTALFQTFSLSQPLVLASRPHQQQCEGFIIAKVAEKKMLLIWVATYKDNRWCTNIKWSHDKYETTITGKAQEAIGDTIENYLKDAVSGPAAAPYF